MPRIRTLKPEFWADEKLSLLDPMTRLVFLGLISLADDAGRLLDNVKQLDGMLFPNTDDSCGEPLETLARTRRIVRYRSTSGQPLIQIAGWARHQKVDKPSRHVLPGPTDEDVARPAPSERAGKEVPPPQPLKARSRKTREIVAKDSRDSRAPILDLGPGTGDHGPSPEGVPPAAPDGPPALVLGGSVADTPPTGGSSDSAERGGWPARLADVWGEHLGLIKPGRFGRVLFPLLSPKGDRAPPFTSEQACRALAAYLNDHKARGSVMHATPEDFARQFRHWIELTTPFGELSAEQRYALGVA